MRDETAEGENRPPPPLSSHIPLSSLIPLPSAPSFSLFFPPVWEKIAVPSMDGESGKPTGGNSDGTKLNFKPKKESFPMKKMHLILLVISALAFQTAGFAEDAAKKADKPAVKTTEKKADQPANKEAKVTSENSKYKTEKEQLSYAIGVQIGSSFKEETLDIDPKVVSAAIDDVLTSKPLAMSTDELGAVINKFRQKMMEKQEVEQKEQKAKAQVEGAKNAEEGKAFLAKTAKEDGVKSTASGLLYKVITEGKGAQPKATDKVRVHYKGTFINGEQFDSSYDRGEPTEFPLNGVIKGWTEGLQLMKEGSKYMFYIPSELAYGPGRPGIAPNSVLIFQVELLNVLGSK
jgi:FKBP-type peptidyl-prolyl cis-trans isomerase